MKGLKSNHELAEEASESVDAWGRVSAIVSDIVDWEGNGVIALLTIRYDLSGQHLLELVEPELLLKARSALLAAGLSTSSLLLLATFLVFNVLAALHLRLNCFLVSEGAADHSYLQGVIKQGVSVLVLEDLQLDLLVKGREEVGTHGVGLLVAEEANIFEAGKCVPLEELQELLAHGACNLTSLLALRQYLIDSLLEVTPVNFVVAAQLTGLYPLRLHQHGLSALLIHGVVLGKNGVLVRLDHLNASLLESFADEDLEDWLSLQVEVKEVRVYVVDLDGLVCPFLIGDVGGRGWSVDVEVWLDIGLVNHVVAVVELKPIVLGHLHLLLVHLRHLLLLLRVAIVVAVFTVHLLNHGLLLRFLFLSVRDTTISVTRIGKLTFICWSRFLRAAAAFFCFSTLKGSGCMSGVRGKGTRGQQVNSILDFTY